jgi:hypothetical protein
LGTRARLGFFVWNTKGDSGDGEVKNADLCYNKKAKTAIFLIFTKQGFMDKKFYITTPIYYVNDPAAEQARNGARVGTN